MFDKEFDKFNNIDKCLYNCGGFALGLIEWVTPYISCNNCVYVKENLPITDWDELCDSCEESQYARLDYIEYCIDSCGLDTALQIIIKSDVRMLVNKYPFLQRIDASDCIKYNKIIAYRIGVNIFEDSDEIEQDFHFRVKINGKWYEKCGAGAIKEININESSINQPWQVADFVYNSPIIYFIDTRVNNKIL